MRSTLCPAASLVFLLLFMFGRGSTRADIFKPNTSYPDVELLSADSGKLVNLQSLAGTKTVLFIFASW